MNRLDVIDKRIDSLETTVKELRSLMERVLRCSVDPRLQAYLDKAEDANE